MADDYYEVWLDQLGRVSPPDFAELLLNRSGITLEPILCRLLVFLDLRGPLGVLDLAELAESNHPKVSRSLARLENLGLVQRGEADHDRRIKTASITPAGLRVVDAINRGRKRILDEAFDGWSAQDRTDLARLTRRFTDRIVEMMDAQDDRGAE